MSQMGVAARARMECWSPRQNIDATLAAIERAVTRVHHRGAAVGAVATGAARPAASDSAHNTARKLSE